VSGDIRLMQCGARCCKTLQRRVCTGTLGHRHMRVLGQLALLLVLVRAVACEVRLRAEGKLTGFTPCGSY
jgi:hypothetical protein